MAELRLVAGRAWEDRDLAFPNTRGGPLAENHILVSWHRALEQVRLPDGTALPRIRMHDLRHTKGTLMADEGEDTVVTQRTLGHARQSVTADLYIGKVPKAIKRAADRFAALLDPDQEAAGWERGGRRNARWNATTKETPLPLWSGRCPEPMVRFA